MSSMLDEMLCAAIKSSVESGNLDNAIREAIAARLQNIHFLPKIADALSNVLGTGGVSTAIELEVIKQVGDVITGAEFASTVTDAVNQFITRGSMGVRFNG